MLVSFGLKNAFPKTKDMDAIQREVIQTFSLLEWMPGYPLTFML